MNIPDMKENPIEIWGFGITGVFLLIALIFDFLLPMLS